MSVHARVRTEMKNVPRSSPYSILECSVKFSLKLPRAFVQLVPRQCHDPCPVLVANLGVSHHYETINIISSACFSASFNGMHADSCRCMGCNCMGSFASWLYCTVLYCTRCSAQPEEDCANRFSPAPILAAQMHNSKKGTAAVYKLELQISTVSCYSTIWSEPCF